MKFNLNGKKILFANVPADGHFNPLMGLAKHFQQLGADVRWLSSDLYKDRLKQSGIDHYPLVKTLDINAGNIAEYVPEIRTNDAFKRITLYRIQYAKRSIEYYEDIKAISSSFPFDCLISDSLFPAIPFVKALLNVPVIAIGVVPLAADSIDTAPYGLGLLPPISDEQRNTYEKLYSEMPERFKEATDIFEQLLRKENVPYERSTIENTLIKSATLYLQIGVPYFDYRRSDLGSNIRFIGALLPATVNNDHTGWYDERLESYNKVILVTQGTVESDPSKLLEPTLQAFINSNVLVIATTGGKSTAALREKYSARNIIIEDFIPFKDVMKFVNVYITNGGYGGTIQSIMNKVPIVAAGLHEGKNEVCARIGYFGIGVNLQTETPSADHVSKAVNEVLTNIIYKVNVSNLADEFEKHDSLQEIIEHVSSLLENRQQKNSHLNYLFYQGPVIGY
jgi:MGT family glycosyltransferase